MKFHISYIKLLESDELKLRATNALQFMNKCKCCPRICGINRNNNEYGFCNSGYLPIVSSFTSHHGESPVYRNKRSGKYFFRNCNLKCIYCQNFEKSQNYKNEIQHEVSHERLAEINARTANARMP
jgi:putative pyruvate formate lyase activating enzyme